MFQKTFSSSCSYQLLGLKLGNGSTPAQATTKAAWRDFKRPLRVEATTKVSLSHSLSLSNLLSILLPFLISLSLSFSRVLTFSKPTANPRTHVPFQLLIPLSCRATVPRRNTNVHLRLSARFEPSAEGSVHAVRATILRFKTRLLLRLQARCS